MKFNIGSLLNRQSRKETSLHPVDLRATKHYIKQRLSKLFPELRGNPRALEDAYRALSLEPDEVPENGDAVPSYSIHSSVL